MSMMEADFETEGEFIRISAEELERESALRDRFAAFWSTASGDQRAVYDAFISGAPLASDAAVDEVNDAALDACFVRPQQARPGQAILFLHGGGYVLGSARAYRGFVSQIVSRTQIPALVIDYPLAPEATLPAAPDAARFAWEWLVAHGFERIAIVGDSAGGGLTLVTLQGLASKPHGPAPIAGVVFSPWTDLSLSGASMLDPDVADPLIGSDYLRDCAGKYAGRFGVTDPLASPLFGDMKGLPPLLVQVGTDERLLDDSRRFARRAAQAGVPVELQIFEGMHHVFQLDVAHLETSRTALDRAAGFLRNAFERR
ncbi:alpha/beta hydrolase [Bradyrhizobium liaoningense]|uniref:alpha/beta hydrolase n=1 Tax=Bradyrhizobium liaoningense TaxID=43992 RepID=UPI001BA6F9AE|nr:alpha/beta hydrolase [Bradyrhizobium liaoningense]MBR0738479.1 alpha/beta hydrolase [Bradyrhizobium liaoningense]